MGTKAQTLWQAQQNKKAIQRFTLTEPEFSLKKGYEVQKDLLMIHLASGSRLSGWKMGMTSLAKMQQMKIDSPIHGFLTNKMLVEEGSEYSLQNSIQAKVEPEIAFIMGKSLSGVPSIPEALACVEAVGGALEIIDSRYIDYDFQLPDVVADNCSSSGYVLGSKWIKVSQCKDLNNLGIILEQNGKATQFGSSAAILGDPVRSLVSLVKLLHERGEKLEAGAVVLAGGATAAIPLVAGSHVRATFQQLGAVEFRVEK